MQGMLDRAGIKEGATKEDFAEGFGKVQEEFRGERGGDGQSRDRRGSQNSKYYTPAKKDRVTVDLPDDYKARDEDADGQIGLYEWRAYRGDLDEFFAYDHNGDGFLTPREIAAGPMQLPSEDSGGQTELAGGPAATSAPAGDPEAEKGLNFFRLLDGDRDGRASPQELTKLKKLRPAFEKAGISLDQEMTQEQFVANYLKAVRQ
jgi:hypothetical protein